MSHLSDGIARHRKYKRPLGCVRFSREWRQWRKSNQQICVNKHTSGRVYRRFRRHIRVLRFMARANSGPTSGDFQRRRPLMETFGTTRRWLEEIDLSVTGDKSRPQDPQDLQTKHIDPSAGCSPDRRWRRRKEMCERTGCRPKIYESHQMCQVHA